MKYQSDPGFPHAKITIIPDNQERYRGDARFGNTLADGRVFATVGAGPESNGFSPGNLVSGINRERDVMLTLQGQNLSDQLLILPEGMGEDSFIERLFSADNAYQDNLPYWYFPDEEEGSFNSNSYASGLLRALNVPEIQQPPRTPGFNIPVPERNYRRGTVTVQDCADVGC